MKISRSAFLNRVLKSLAFKYTALGAAHYPYNVEPTQLAYLVRQIDRLRDVKGNIAEIGVARGMTTRFLAEHIRNEKLDSGMRYFAIDTFTSFTNADLDYEVQQRGKKRKELVGFNYFDYDAFKRQFAQFSFVEAIQSDCTLVNYKDLAPLKLVFLDVDLYLPTKKTLPLLLDSLVDGGVIAVDDVQDKMSYDGAHQAYMEFVKERGLNPVLIGNKCGVYVKN